MKKLAISIFAIAMIAAAASAQSTAIRFEGSLIDGGVPLSGDFEIRLQLYKTATGDNAVTGEIDAGVRAVADGRFDVLVDLGSDVFNGDDRFMELRFRPAGGDAPFMVISPRQLIPNAAYALLAKKALQAEAADAVGGQSAPAVARATAAANSATANNTAGSIVRRDANGGFSAAEVNATSHFSLEGEPVLSVRGSMNLFAGRQSGRSNTQGEQNTFVGASSGAANTSGFLNTFVGALSGAANSTGGQNTFTGAFAGNRVTTGGLNAFYGVQSGLSTTNGTRNSFFGAVSGQQNSTGFDNAFFGFAAGRSNTTAAANSFFGTNAGETATTGGANTFIGFAAGRASSTGSSNTFIGRSAGASNASGSSNTVVGANADVASGGLSFAAAFGAGAQARFANSVTLGRGIDMVHVPGTLRVDTLASNGTTLLCRSAQNLIALCPAFNGASRFGLDAEVKELRAKVDAQERVIGAMRAALCSGGNPAFCVGTADKEKK